MVYTRRLDLVNKAIREKIVFNIFTALLGIVQVCVLVRAIAKMILRQSERYDEDRFYEQTEEDSEYEEISKENSHVWMN